MKLFNKAISQSRSLILIIALLFTLGKFSSAQQRPNILLVIAEGIDPSFIPPYGNSTIKTPNLTWLADNGIVFTRMFSTYGVCAPSRTAMITGMYPTAIGAMDQRTMTAHSTIPYLPDYETIPPADVKCFTEYLRAAGYYCTNHGKTDFQFASPVTAWDENKSTASWVHRKKGQPFFSIYNIGITHESQLWLRQDEPLRVDPAKVPVPPYFPQHNAVVRRQIARMYDNNLLMDEELGMLLDSLKRDHLLDSTVIIFTCDHNGPLPWYKREVSDRGTHIPFIVYLPGKKNAGSKDTELHSTVDLAPTILSLSGLPVPKYMQGQAFLGKKKSGTPRKYVYTARDRMDEQYDLIRAVRDKQFQYIRNYNPDLIDYRDNAYRLRMPMMQEILRLKAKDSLNPELKRWFAPKTAEELYDVQKDPYELNNLAADPTYAKVASRMRDALNDWIRLMRDKGFMQERDLIQLMWQGVEKPVTRAPEVTKKSIEGNIALLTISSATTGASIAYRLSSDPPDYWHLYTKPVSVSLDSILFIKAIRLGFDESKLVTYTVK